MDPENSPEEEKEEVDLEDRLSFTIDEDVLLITDLDGLELD